jgi:2-keto-4-pentenoate hydratase
MLKPGAIESAARLLLEARRKSTPLEALPEACRPKDEADAYAIQDAVARQLGHVHGWKVGAPTPDAAASFGPIFTIVKAPAQFPSASHRLFGIEAEIAFRFGRDLPGGAPRELVLASVAGVHLAMEIVESRFKDFRAAGPLSVLADNISNGALVLGPELRQWQGIDLAQPPSRVVIDGVEAGRCTTGNTGGDPIRLLVALVNHAAARGKPITAGQVVTTGATTGMHFARPGSVALADFGDWGQVETAFSR